MNIAADIHTHSDYQIAGRPLDQILPRLDALMMVLKTCKDKVCSFPWRTLHPDGHVLDLKDALNKKFDSFYASQPKMSFTSCSDAYYAELENQEPVKPWKQPDESGQGLLRQEEFNYAMHWHLLT